MTKNPINIVLGMANVVCVGLNVYWAVGAYYNPNLPAWAPLGHIAVGLLNGMVAYICLTDKKWWR